MCVAIYCKTDSDVKSFEFEWNIRWFLFFEIFYSEITEKINTLDFDKIHQDGQIALTY